MKKNKTKFILLLTLLLGFGFLSTSLVSFFVARASLSDQIAESTLPLTSDTIYSEIQQDLLKPIYVSSLMANDTFVRNWVLDGEKNPERIEHYLRVFQDKYKAFTAFFISEKTRRYFHPSGKQHLVREDNLDDDWYFHARDMKGDYEINVDTDKMNDGTLTVFINHKVHDFDGNYIGITGVGLAVDTMRTLVEQYQKRYGRQVYFVDREGDVKLHGKGFKGAKNIRETMGLGAYATQLLATPSGSFRFERDNQRVYLNSRLVREFDWYLMVEEEENLEDSPILHTLIANLVAALAITVVVLSLAFWTLGRYQSRLEDMATRDHLTRAVNRQAFDLLYHQAVSATDRRDNASLSIIMIDVDHFKRVNDTYGHLAGDEMLVRLAETARTHIRQGDVLCRWGGEEFLVLLPDCDAQGARAIAEKIRVAIGMQQVHLGSDSISVTVSAGISEYKPSDTEDSLIRRVDGALYDAKAQGRNRVSVAAL